jgi:UDP-2,4-diacetamido-2,4,6-trideoxy-beta-L-altropyranose hydrolase
MLRPQLIIRADASTAIGVGHIMRCLAIAQAWQDAGGDTTFASAALAESLQTRIRTEGFQACSITAVPGSLTDAAQLLSVAAELRATAIILDGYAYGVEYHDTIANASFTSLAIDDNSHLESYSTDFVLNQNAGITISSYPSRSSQTELLLGTSYALLRREFLASTVQPESRIDGRRILVTLGGSDPENITATVVKGLQSIAGLDFEVRLIVGAMNPHADCIADLIASNDQFEMLQNVADMSEQYCWADLVIAAGGSSNWEMCYFGLPRIVLVIADNQIQIANELEREQIAINLGHAATVEPHDVRNAVEFILNDASRLLIARQQSIKLVDGRGAVRCVKRLLGHARSQANVLTAARQK